MVHFWLDKHDYFRRQCSTLQSATGDYREQRTTPPDFGVWLAPRLQGFIAHLHGHAQIEDLHYFPAFRAAEQRLATGIDTLAQDHELLHEGIGDIIETVNEFITAISADSTSNLDVQRRLGDRFADTSEILYRRLLRHLDDEEDLIIPLMLDRGT